MPIDPAILGVGNDWQLPGLDGLGAPGAPGADATAVDPTVEPSSESFGSMLGKQLGNLADLQVEAADAGRALADGTAGDPTSVVMAVERARMAMQLASQIRTKSVEAINDVFHTQV